MGKNKQQQTTSKKQRILSEKQYSLKSLYELNPKRYVLHDMLMPIMGSPSLGGIWTIEGSEKNGKTWWAIRLTELLAEATGPVMYVSAEEGVDAEFIDTFRRVGVPPNLPVKVIAKISIAELREYLNTRHKFRFIVLDNATMYADELTSEQLKQLKLDFPKITFIMVCHVEDNKLYTSLARQARRLAKIICRVEGLRVDIFGRCPGGAFVVDEKAAQLYHNHELVENSSKV